MKTALQLKNEGIEAFNKKEWEKAYNFYEEALALDKDQITIWERLDQLMSSGNNTHIGKALPDNAFYLKQLEIIENLIRLNPEMRRDVYDQAMYDNLYYSKFKVLCRLGRQYDYGREERVWSEEYKNKAIEALKMAVSRRPESRDFYKTEAEAVGLSGCIG